MQKAYLILENGTIFEGKSFGAQGEAIGEVVFTTGMVGYLETLTDPNYFGQIVVHTFPLIGNYGVIPADFESDHPQVKAYIVRDWCQEPSNFRCEGNLDTFLKKHNVIGLYGIDTRALTKVIRENGVMNGKIVTEGSGFGLDDLKNYKIVDAVKNTTCSEIKTYAPEGNAKRRICLYDFGATSNLVDEFVKRDCVVTVVPAYTKAESVVELSPDGIVLSYGPGNPAKNKEIVGEIKKLVEKKIPMFALGLGHQILALANGGKTEKLKYGHRGSNQPATNLSTGKVYVTSQNHGYTVVNDSMKGKADISFINTNDGTCEGLKYTNIPAFSVQFAIDTSGGPLDTSFMYDDFVKMIDANN